MSLDFADCDRARLARDAAYDGRFYTGVHTTGIYCRPVCPVRPARSANVSFFPSAAAAEAAGFRACLRCRPGPRQRKIDSGGTLHAYQRLIRAAVLIRLLRASQLFPRFHTAWTLSSRCLRVRETAGRRKASAIEPR